MMPLKTIFSSSMLMLVVILVIFFTTPSNAASARLNPASDRWAFLASNDYTHGRALSRGAKQGLFVECQEPEETHRVLIGDASVQMALPMPDGTTAYFTLHDTTADAMEQDLRQRFPGIRTLSGTCKACGMVTAKVVVGGGTALHVQFLAPSWVGYMDPVYDQGHRDGLRIFRTYVQRSEMPNNDTPTAEEGKGLSSDDAEWSCDNDKDENNKISAQERRIKSIKDGRNNSSNDSKHPDRSLQSTGTCQGVPAWTGDTLCDHMNNNAECGYDGGDCCLRNANVYFCDANSPIYGAEINPCSCLDPVMSGPDENGCLIGYIGDGVCDSENNRPECQYDGDDCCSMFASREGCDSSIGSCTCEDPTRGEFPLRTYRMAVLTSMQYSKYHGNTRTSVLAAVLVATQRASGILQQATNVALQLVANADDLFELDSPGDTPIVANNKDVVSGATDLINAIIGETAYDIGHVFNTAAAGYAPGRVCAGDKGNAVTGVPNPTGDGFYVDYLLHEIAHQFSATHTFNGIRGSCQGANQPSTSFEPGSGSTIMSYSGLCAGDNIAAHSDAYFHVASLEQINSYVRDIERGGRCGLTSVVGVAEAPQFKMPIDSTSCIVPKETPFQLEVDLSTFDLGSVDIESPSQAPTKEPEVVSSRRRRLQQEESLRGAGDSLFQSPSVSVLDEPSILAFSWEGIDAGHIGPLPQPGEVTIQDVNSPLFASQYPQVSSIRTFPDWDYLFSPTTNSMARERLPNVERKMKFSLSARRWASSDSESGSNIGSANGGYYFDTVTVQVRNLPPFAITSSPSDVYVMHGQASAMNVAWPVQSVSSLVDELSLFITFDLGVSLEPLVTGIVSSTGAQTVTVPDSFCSTNGNILSTRNGHLILAASPTDGCRFFTPPKAIALNCEVPTTDPPTPEDVYIGVDTTMSQSWTVETCAAILSSEPANERTCFHLAIQTLKKYMTTYAHNVLIENGILEHEPTQTPSKLPSASPTRAPTHLPTFSPTKLPTQLPTNSPTKTPTTQSPTNKPSVTPTKLPTHIPTKYPTKTPTQTPSKRPTTEPTKAPSMAPVTNFPTKIPSRMPTNEPTAAPTKSPTRKPSISPTYSPTTSPTSYCACANNGGGGSVGVEEEYEETLPPYAPPPPTRTRTPTRLPTEKPTPAIRELQAIDDDLPWPIDLRFFLSVYGCAFVSGVGTQGTVHATVEVSSWEQLNALETQLDMAAFGSSTIGAECVSKYLSNLVNIFEQKAAVAETQQPNSWLVRNSRESVFLLHRFVIFYPDMAVAGAMSDRLREHGVDLNVLASAENMQGSTFRINTAIQQTTRLTTSPSVVPPLDGSFAAAKLLGRGEARIEALWATTDEGAEYLIDLDRKYSSAMRVARDNYKVLAVTPTMRPTVSDGGPTEF